MIVYEPPGDASLPRGSRIRRRELAAFLASAQRLAGLEGEVSVLLSDDAALQRLNARFRRKNKPTDVLSFPASPLAEFAGVQPPPVAGDLAISVETASRQAAALGHSLETELKVLLLHGLLHLAGFDHETDDGGRMLRAERRLRRALGLPQGLVERAGGPIRLPAKAARKSRSKATA